MRSKIIDTYDVNPDEQESVRSWVMKNGLCWCPSCNIPLSRHSTCRRCGGDAVPLQTNLRGETRPVFPGELEIQDIAHLVPDDAWLVVTDNTDLAYSVLVDGDIVGDLIFESDKWQLKIVAHSLQAAKLFPPSVYIDESVLGYVLNHQTVKEPWARPLRPIKAGEYVAFKVDSWHGVAHALVDMDPEAIPSPVDALKIVSAYQDKIKMARKPSHGKFSAMKAGFWRFSTLPAYFRRRMQKAIDANKDTLLMLEKMALDRIDDMVKQNPDRPIAVSFSGGKDSALVTELLRQYYLARNQNVQMYAFFADTGIEFPETYEYMRQLFAEPRYAMIKLIQKKAARDFYELWNEFGAPSRYSRWCCGTQKLQTVKMILEEFGTEVIVCNGSRAGESVARSRRTITDTNPYVEGQITVQPILDWGLLEVWLYLFMRDVLMSPLYLMGFNRTGCYPCPYSSDSILATVEKTHPNLIATLRNNLRKQNLDESWRLRIPPNIDETLKMLEKPQRIGEACNLIQVSNLCAGEYYVYTKTPILLDIEKAIKKLGQKYKIKRQNDRIAEFFYKKDISVHLTRSAKMIIVGTKDQGQAKKVYVDVLNIIGVDNNGKECVGCAMSTEELSSMAG